MPGNEVRLTYGPMTLPQLRQLAADTGFPDPDLAAAVAMAESQGKPNATNIHGALPPSPRFPHGALPERSFGLWQINTLAHPSYDEAQLLDPAYNAAAALEVSSKGENWHPWSTYTDGTYRKYMPGGEPAPAGDGMTPGEAALVASLGLALVGLLRKRGVRL